MRLPWLQVDQDGLGRCRLLARLLGVPETQGIGMGLALWQWALEIAPDGDFSGRVPDSALMSAAVGWPVPYSDRLVTELQRVGLVATEPELRVRGLDRYRRSWEKNQRKPHKGAEFGRRVPETGASSAGNRAEPARQTQTQIQTQIETPKELLVELARPTGAQEVFEHWRQVLDKPRALFSADRRRKVEARLREGRSVEDLKRAVDGCASTPFNRGENDRGQRYDDLELICRTNAHVERFMANAEAPPTPHVDVRRGYVDATPGQGEITSRVVHGGGK